MEGMNYIFDPVDRFVAGTVGQPGERSFYLQAKSGTRVVSVLLEKNQVAAMAERLNLLLRELKRNDSSFRITPEPRDDGPLETPVTEEFRVGVISLSWLGDRNMVAIDLQSLPVNDSEIFDSVGEEPDESADVMRVVLTPAQTESFAQRALSLVGAGRPPCPFCGLAIDPQGHLCPRANGYRR